jgi:osmotically inducible protein OsmC
LSFRIVRRAQARWHGTDADGGGRISLGSGAFEGPYTLKARVSDVERSTNPEELLGAAEAGCYTMSLANLLTTEGHPPEDLQTTASVRLEQVDEGRFSITRIDLETVGEVRGLARERFAELAEQAKATCPISRALAGTDITVSASLAGG